MVRIESGGASFLRRVSAKIKRFMPGMMAKIATISPQPPLCKLGRVGCFLKKAFKSSPTTNPAPQVFQLQNMRFPCPLCGCARPGLRCPFLKRETCGHTLDSLPGWWSEPAARHARSWSPPDLRPAACMKKSLTALFLFIILDDQVS
jgi:hypothetical protein